MNEKQFIPILKETRRAIYAEFEKWSNATYRPKKMDDVNSKIYDAIHAIDELVREIQESEEESPMMKQYRELKAKHPDAILLFRCGDFYESWEDDAKVCAHVLGITLTENRSGKRMAGFPHHTLDIYLPKLVRAGYRIAICDQLEAPKKVVKRGITEIAKTIAL
jgi:hypothetical protein